MSHGHSVVALALVAIVAGCLSATGEGDAGSATTGASGGSSSGSPSSTGSSGGYGGSSGSGASTTGSAGGSTTGRPDGGGTTGTSGPDAGTSGGPDGGTSGSATSGGSTTGAAPGTSGGGNTAGASSTGGSCPAPFVLCGATCTDTRYDPNNCGGCDAPCLTGQSCSDGSCAGVPDGGDAGFQCEPGEYFCVGEELWQCSLEGNNGQFALSCPGDNDGICQTPAENSSCSANAACCCTGTDCSDI